MKVFARNLGIWNFAVAHRIYDTLSRSPEFFVAHRADWLSMAMVVAALSIGPPVLFSLLEVACRQKYPKVAFGLAFGLMSILAGLGVGQFVRLFGLHWIAVGSASALLGILAAVALLRTRAGNVVAMILAVLAPVSPALLLLNRNVALALITQRAERGVESPAEGRSTRSEPNGAPVVILVFDELPTAALLDAERRIDTVRWPELSRLAATATWYRNATSASSETIYSIPALLTGKYPVDQRPPNLASHPDNLFALLDGHYTYNVFEPVTAMLPSQRGGVGKSRLVIAKDILIDLAVVYGHVALPSDLVHALPPIHGQNAFFGRTPVDEREGWSVGNGRLEQVDRFVNKMTGANFELGFLHQMLPHHPWQFLPSGRSYTDRGLVVPGTQSFLFPWPADPGVTDTALQRHLLQGASADRTIGRVVDKLRRMMAFDRTLLIVTADHGIAFGPERSPRQPSPETYKDVMYVPLIIKFPGQSQDRISDANVEQVDIFPTIADVLGVDLDHPIAGTSLLNEGHRRGSLKTFYSAPNGLYEQGQWPAPGGGEFTSLQPLIRRMVVQPADAWVRPVSPCDDLLGKDRGENARSFIGQGAISIRTNRDQMYGGVGPEEFTEGWIVGRVEKPSVANKEVHLAISVGGSIRAITRTFSTRRGRNEFTVLLPDRLAGIERQVDVDVFVPEHTRCGVVAQRLGESKSELSFSPADPSDSFGAGWSGVEVSGESKTSSRWATGSEAQLFLALPREAFEMSFLAATHSRNPDQTMTLSVDGKAAGWARVSTDDPRWYRFLVSADPRRPRYSRVLIRFGSWNIPNGADPRELAVNFFGHKVSLAPADRRQAFASLDFSSYDAPENFGAGWSDPEVSSTGELSWRWAVGKTSMLNLALPQGKLELSFLANTHAFNPAQRVTVTVDGMPAGSASVKSGPGQWLGPFSIPVSPKRPKTSRIELRFAEANRPGGPDMRNLAAGFFALRVEPAKESE